MWWCSLLLCAGQQASTETPAALAALQQAVALPTAKARAAAARDLARDKEVSLEQWLQWMAAFGDFEAAKAGLQAKHVALTRGGESVERELVLWVPSAYDPARPWPLLMLLHGSNGNGLSMVQRWQSFAEEHGYLLLAPTDPESSQGYAFTEAERQEAMAALRWMRLHFNVDEDRIHLHGVSRGGHLAWDLATRYPDRFASLVPAIGGPTWTVAKGRNNMRFLENLHRLPIRDLQGSQDDPHLLRNLHQAMARLEAAGNADAKLIEFPELGHDFRLDGVVWADFFAAARRDPLPSIILYRQVRTEQPRDAWLRLDRFDKEVKESFTLKVGPEWAKMDDFQRAAEVVRLADERTAKVRAERLPDGSFSITTEGLKQGSLFLPLPWLPADGRLSLTVDGKDLKPRVKASKNVLLLDFVERFDRRFLPVAEVPFKP